MWSYCPASEDPRSEPQRRGSAHEQPFRGPIARKRPNQAPSRVGTATCDVHRRHREPPAQSRRIAGYSRGNLMLGRGSRREPASAGGPLGKCREGEFCKNSEIGQYQLKSEQPRADGPNQNESQVGSMDNPAVTAHRIITQSDTPRHRPTKPHRKSLRHSMLRSGGPAGVGLVLRRRINID